MLQLIPIPAFEDNYIWLLRRGAHAVVVDPGDAVPVISRLQAQSLQLDAILVTHHHADHIGGVADLLLAYPEALIYAPKKGVYAFQHVAVGEKTSIHFPHLELELTVMEIPGHTLDHIAYYGANHLFCGDTLFSAGCGRLFEGTPQQMLHSLRRLAALPPDTKVCCGHEYTLHNLAFARQLDEDNPALQDRLWQARQLRAAGLPTLPSTLAIELATNPFLRCEIPALQASSGSHSSDPLSVFTAIRQLRNHF